MTIGERIRHLRKALRLTQTEFASRIGITYKMLGLYEKGVYEPSEKVLKLISSTFGVSYNWLKSGQGEIWENREKALLEKLGYVPVVKRVDAGFPENPANMDVVGWVLVSKESLQKGGKFAVQVQGNSMEPTLHNGDFVIFKPYVGDGTDIPNGKVVVVRNHHGELVVRRLTRVDNAIVLTPDNLKYPPLQPSAELQIVGLAVEAMKRVEL